MVVDTDLEEEAVEDNIILVAGKMIIILEAVVVEEADTIKATAILTKEDTEEAIEEVDTGEEEVRNPQNPLDDDVIIPHNQYNSSFFTTHHITQITPIITQNNHQNTLQDEANVAVAAAEVDQAVEYHSQKTLKLSPNSKGTPRKSHASHSTNRWASYSLAVTMAPSEYGVALPVNVLARST